MLFLKYVQIKLKNMGALHIFLVICQGYCIIKL